MATLLKTIYADNNYYYPLNARNRFRIRLEIYEESSTSTSITLSKRWCVEMYSESSLAPEKIASSATYSYDGGAKTGSSLQLGPGSGDVSASIWWSDPEEFSYADIANGSKLTYGAGSVQYSSSSGTKYSKLTAGSYTPPIPAFEISYRSDVSGASGIPNSQWKDYGATATISNAIPTLANATFDNKWLGSDNLDHASGSSYSNDASLTLTAYWKPTATLIYNANGGSSVPASQSASAATSATSNLASLSISATVSSTVPTNADNTKRFVGWSRSQSSETGDIQPGSPITLSMGQNVLYAIWGPATNMLEVQELAWGIESTLTITQVTEGTHDTLSWVCGTKSGYLTITNDEATFTPVLATLAPEFPNSTTVYVTFTISTFGSDDTPFGSTSITRELEIPDNSSTKPTVGAVTASKTGTYSWTTYYIQGKTQVLFSCAPTPKLGATIAYVNFTFGGNTTRGAVSSGTWSAVFSLPNAGNNQNVSIIAVDSRGFASNAASLTTGINVKAYMAPVIGSLTYAQFTTLTDPSGEGIETRVNTTVMEDNYHESTYGSYRIDYQLIGSSNMLYDTGTLSNAVTTETRKKYSQPDGAIENGKQYNVKVTITDNLGGTAQKTYNVFTSTVAPVVDVFEDKAVAFGTLAEVKETNHKNVQFGSDDAPWDIYAGPATTSISDTLYATVSSGSRKINWVPVEIPSITIDDEMSSTSENPVQNKVIYAAMPTFGTANHWQYILYPNGYVHAWTDYGADVKTTGQKIGYLQTPFEMSDVSYSAQTNIPSWMFSAVRINSNDRYVDGMTIVCEISSSGSGDNSNKVMVSLDGYAADDEPLDTIDASHIGWVLNSYIDAGNTSAGDAYNTVFTNGSGNRVATYSGVRIRTGCDLKFKSATGYEILVCYFTSSFGYYGPLGGAAWNAYWTDVSAGETVTPPDGVLYIGIGMRKAGGSSSMSVSEVADANLVITYV